jgi:hypothetical protein
VPITYVLDLESCIVHTRCTGAVTFEEVLFHFAELEADPSVPPRLDVLLDLTAMDSLPESSQLESVAAEIDRLRTKITWGGIATVASRDALYGMTRVFQVFAEQVFAHAGVFRDLEEATRWIGSLRPPVEQQGD